MSKDTKICPFCAETIKAAAIVCRYCGRDLPVVISTTEKAEEKIEPVEKIEEVKKVETEEQTSTISENVRILIGLVIACVVVLVILYNVFMLPHSSQFIYATPTNKDTYSQEELDLLKTTSAGMEEMNTTNPDGHLHEVMQKEGVTLTAKEVQYDMANNLGNEFGLSGDATLCDYYNYGYDESIKSRFFCVNVIPPSGNYQEQWYIYFDRNSASQLYQDLLKGDVQIFLTAKVEKSRYDTNQGNMAFGLYVEWIK